MSNAFRKSCFFVVIIAPLVSGCVRGEAIEMAQATANQALATAQGSATAAQAAQASADSAQATAQSAAAAAQSAQNSATQAVAAASSAQRSAAASEASLAEARANAAAALQRAQFQTARGPRGWCFTHVIPRVRASRSERHSELGTARAMPNFTVRTPEVFVGRPRKLFVAFQELAADQHARISDDLVELVVEERSVPAR
jgi:hypothetical protein